MKRLKKVVLILFVLLLVAIGSVVLMRNSIAQSSLERAVTEATGFPLTVAAVNIPFSFNAIDVHGVSLNNPAGFEDKQFIDMPQLEASGGFATLFGTPHIQEMTLDLRTLLISHNAKGEWNSQKLAGIYSSGGSKYQIDALHLKIGSVTVRDHTVNPQSEKIYRLDINSTYKNVTSANDVMRLIFFTLLMKGKLPDIGVSSSELAKNLGGITDAAGGLISGAEGLMDMGKDLFGGKKK